MSDKKTSEMPEPMDVTAREARVGTAHHNHSRVCYAIKTLVAEVHELFPETPVEYSNFDGRYTALDVTFDLTVLDDEDEARLARLLSLIENDARVAEVIADEDGAALVSIRSNPRTQDMRDPFGLGPAYLLLAGDDDMSEFDVLDEGGSL